MRWKYTNFNPFNLLLRKVDCKTYSFFKEAQMFWIHFQDSNKVLLEITVAFMAAWNLLYINYVPEKWRIFLFVNMAVKMYYL